MSRPVPFWEHSPLSTHTYNRYPAAERSRLKLTQTDTLPTSEDPDEGELIREAQRDPAAFEPLYDHYVRGLYRYVLSRGGTSTEAEDVTSQTFLSALEALPR